MKKLIVFIIIGLICIVTATESLEISESISMYQMAFGGNKVIPRNLETDIKINSDVKVSTTDQIFTPGINPLDINPYEEVGMCPGNVTFDFINEENRFGNSLFEAHGSTTEDCYDNNGHTITGINNANNLFLGDMYVDRTNHGPTAGWINYNQNSPPSTYAGIKQTYFYPNVGSSDNVSADGRTALICDGQVIIEQTGTESNSYSLNLEEDINPGTLEFETEGDYTITVKKRVTDCQGAIKMITSGCDDHNFQNQYYLLNSDPFDSAPTPMETDEIEYLFNIRDPTIEISPIGIEVPGGLEELEPGETIDIILKIRNTGIMPDNIYATIQGFNLNSPPFHFEPTGATCENIAGSTNCADFSHDISSGTFSYIVAPTQTVINIEGELTVDMPGQEANFELEYDDNTLACSPIEDTLDLNLDTSLAMYPDYVIDTPTNEYTVGYGQIQYVPYDTLNIGSDSADNESTTRIEQERVSGTAASWGDITSNLPALESTGIYNQEPIPGLGPGVNYRGANFEIRCSNKDLDATYKICADVYNDVADESDETNNCETITIHCREIGPDLYPECPPTGGSIPCDIPLNLRVTTYWDGTESTGTRSYTYANVTENWDGTGLVDETTYEVPCMPNCDPDFVCSGMGTFGLPDDSDCTNSPFCDCGGTLRPAITSWDGRLTFTPENTKTYYIHIISDHNSQVTEIDETNNMINGIADRCMLQCDPTITPEVDLVSKCPPMPNLYAGESANIDIITRNIGDADSNASETFVNGTQIGSSTFSIPILNGENIGAGIPGGEHTNQISISCPASPGVSNEQIEIYVDNTDTNSESDENNIWACQYTCNLDMICEDYL